MRIGIIGSGNIGGTLARLWAGAGHDVWVANSRGPESLAGLVAELGERGHAATVEEAAEQGEVVVVSVPLHAYRVVPVDATAGKVVVDTNNYYPQRDGQVAELDAGTATSSELLQRHLPGARVVKLFNVIASADLAGQGTPTGTPGRRALPFAGDDQAAKDVVARLTDEIGFDVVDAGSLADSWRQQPGTPVYGPRLDAEGVRAALAAASR